MNYENYDPYFPDQPVVDLYLSVWANLPSFRSKPAFIWSEDGPAGETTGSTLTYSQLHNSVQLISSNLLSTLQRGDTVLILCSPGLELIVSIFGCQRAGLLAVPTAPPNPSFTSHDHHNFVRVISQTKPKAAIAHGDFINHVKKYISSSHNKKLTELLQSVKWISTEEIRDKNKVSQKWDYQSYNGCKPEEVYLIQYTSGATTIPKPVLVTAGAAVHNVRTARKSYELDPNSIIVSWLPQYHDCGLMFLLLTIVSGATCVLTSPKHFINRPPLWLELITEFKATCTPVPSFTLPLVLKRGGLEITTKPINLSTLKNLIIINEPILKSSVQEFVEVFKHFGLNPSSISPSYGLAENCTFVSTSWRRGEEITNISHHNKLLPSARLDHHNVDEDHEINILIVNKETRELVEDGIEGEIWVSSPSNAKGYLAHPSLTKDVFHAKIRNNITQTFLRTGDRGLIKGKERFLYITGRSSDIIKIPENRQFTEKHPHYIETVAYKSCPKFLRGGCIATFEVSRTIVVVAEMQRSEKEIWVLRKICEGIREAIENEEGIEIGLVVLVKSGSVPKTTSGKIQRWLAKYKLLEGEMKVIMEMKFDDHCWDSISLGMISDGRDVVGEERESIVLSPPNGSTHMPLISSL